MSAVSLALPPCLKSAAHGTGSGRSNWNALEKATENGVSPPPTRKEIFIFNAAALLSSPDRLRSIRRTGFFPCFFLGKVYLIGRKIQYFWIHICLVCTFQNSNIAMSKRLPSQVHIFF